MHKLGGRTWKEHLLTSSNAGSSCTSIVNALFYGNCPRNLEEDVATDFIF